MRKITIAANEFKDALKAKGRARRKSAADRTDINLFGQPRRNHVTPALRLETLPVDQLRSNGRRLRRSMEAHVCEVAQSISALGFTVPLLIGRDNVVIDGDTRLEAARVLGLEFVPCVRVDHLNENEQRLLRLAVNRLGEKGEWDVLALQTEFQELIIEDVQIELSGFCSDEIDQIIIGEQVESLEVGELDPRAGTKPIAELGDVFNLGRHTLICGDATDPMVTARLMGSDKARLVLTDEPYNVRIVGNVTKGDHREFAMASGEMSDERFIEFNRAWMGAILPFLVDGGILGTFIDWRGMSTVHAAAMNLGLSQLNLVVWTKTNAGMGSLYRSQHELLPLFKMGALPHLNNIALGRRGRHRSNVWSYPGASSIGSDARSGLRDHPTVKPTAMLEDALIDLTNSSDIVVDPFLGSGSTVIAAEKRGRICRGIELDPLYVDVIIRRWQRVTGKAATLGETGESFADLSQRRQDRASRESQT